MVRPCTLRRGLVATALAVAIDVVGAATTERPPLAAGAAEQPSRGPPSPVVADEGLASTSDDQLALLQTLLSVQEQQAKAAKQRQQPPPQPSQPVKAAPARPPHLGQAAGIAASRPAEVAAPPPRGASLASLADNTTVVSSLAGNTTVASSLAVNATADGGSRASERVSGAAGQAAGAAGSSSAATALAQKQGDSAELQRQQLQAPGSNSTTIVAVSQSRISAMVILVILVLCVCMLLFILALAYSRFSHLKDMMPDFHANFSMYLSYRTQSWINHGGERSKAQLMLVVCIIFVYIGTGLYCLLVGANPGTAMFTVYQMIMDPAAGYGEPTAWGKFIGILMAVGFLFVLALLVAVVQDSVEHYFTSIRSGFSPVVEVGHILLIGFTEDTLAVVQELCYGYEAEGGTTIVLLAEESKAQIEAEISQARLHLLNSTVVVRSGSCNNVENLRRVSVESCATVILAPKRLTHREVRDAMTMQMLVMLAGKGWPLRGRILAVCSLVRNRPLMEKVGGPKTDIINVDDFLGKLMVQCSNQPGIGKVVASVFRSEGCEFYIKPVPPYLVGKTFHEAQFYYQESVLAGLFSADQDSRSLCPPMSTVLTKDHEVVLFAEDITGTAPKLHPVPVAVPQGADFSPKRSRMQRGPSPKVETIFMFGWNHQIVGVLLFELEDVVAKGSKVIFLAPDTLDHRNAYLERLQKRLDRKFVNLSHFTHIIGRIGSRHELESLPVPVTKASRIFCLSDGTIASASMADASTTTMVLMVRDILAGSPDVNNSVIPIVPEIRARMTNQLFQDLKVEDLVDTSGTPSQIIATVTHVPKLATVLFDLISDTGHVGLFIRKLSDYMPSDAPLPVEVNYWEALHYISAQGDVLLGWDKVEDEEEEEEEEEAANAFSDRMKGLTMAACYNWDMNPHDKMTKRPWDSDHDVSVVVLAQHERPVSRQRSLF